MAVQGSKQLYRVVVHPFLVRHETEIDETLQNIGERGKKVLGKVTQHGINLAATTVVTSAIKVCLSLSSLTSLPSDLLQGQAVITETLLQNQRAQQEQQEQQMDGGEAAQPDSQENQRQNHPSSSSTSSYYSEEYEVIGGVEPEENCESPSLLPCLSPPRGKFSFSQLKILQTTQLQLSPLPITPPLPPQETAT